MSIYVSKIIFIAIILICLGLLLALVTKNILKIFLGAIITYNSSVLLLSCLCKTPDKVLAFVLTTLTPFIFFAGFFTIIKIYRKYNTLDLSKIEEIAKGER